MEVCMVENTRGLGLTRRRVLMAAAGFSGVFLVPPTSTATGEGAGDLVERLTGKRPSESDRVHLEMPRVFPNGYTVPLALMVDTAMTDIDHVRHVRVLAPLNPIVEVATFHFVPQRSEPRVSTRIRLAGPQEVLAIAEMSGGELLMARTWVEVATNGCT
jgi:sulfur-oxidizing protein SoxY